MPGQHDSIRTWGDLKTGALRSVSVRAQVTECFSMNACIAASSTAVNTSPTRYLNGLPLAACSRRAHNSLPWQKQGASSDGSVRVTMCPTSGEVAQITCAPVAERSTRTPASRADVSLGFRWEFVAPGSFFGLRRRRRVRCLERRGEVHVWIAGAAIALEALQLQHANPFVCRLEPPGHLASGLGRRLPHRVELPGQGVALGNRRVGSCLRVLAGFHRPRVLGFDRP